MAYEDDRDMDLDRSLYEDESYEPETYFGERLGDSTDAAADDSDMSLEEYEDTDDETEPSFGESLNPTYEEDTTDSTSSAATESEPVSRDEHDSLVDKAKDKLDDLTGHNE
jgi:hypothetical protein